MLHLALLLSRFKKAFKIPITYRKNVDLQNNEESKPEQLKSSAKSRFKQSYFKVHLELYVLRG